MMATWCTSGSTCSGNKDSNFSIMNVEKSLMAPGAIEFSKVVQGYWRMSEWGRSDQESLAFLQKHTELGVTTVDHAHVYGSQPSCEELFGRAMALKPSIRDEIQIVTKCGINLNRTASIHVNHYDSRYQAIIASTEESLKRLKIENIDVLLLHRPDYLMIAAEVSEAFARLKAGGKVDHFGVSNFSAGQFDLLQSRLDQPLVTNQIELNPLNTHELQNGVLEFLQQNKVKPMAWSCLAGGAVLNGKSDSSLRVRATLEQIKEETGAKGIDQVAYAWVNKLPSQPVLISGSGKLTRLEQAIKALELELTHEQWYRVLISSLGQNLP